MPRAGAQRELPARFYCCIILKIPLAALSFTINHYSLTVIIYRCFIS